MDTLTKIRMFFLITLKDINHLKSILNKANITIPIDIRRDLSTNTGRKKEYERLLNHYYDIKDRDNESKD